MSENLPLEDPIEEGRRVIEAADENGLSVKQIGGTAIYEHAETAHEEPFKRGYRDIDFVGTRDEEQELVDLMKDLRYDANRRFNTMRNYRLEFQDEENGRKCDYILDKFDFCHHWSLSERIEMDHPTVPIEDLLMSKLQIVEVSDRDVRDMIAIVSDHPVESGDSTEKIDPAYVAGLCEGDWGLYKTTTMSIDRIEEYIANNDLPLDEATIQNRLDTLRNEIETHPKTFRWKLRSIIGERKQWYNQPELG